MGLVTRTQPSCTRVLAERIAGPWSWVRILCHGSGAEQHGRLTERAQAYAVGAVSTINLVVVRRDA
jgi:hypothetical protein